MRRLRSTPGCATGDGRAAYRRGLCRPCCDAAPRVRAKAGETVPVAIRVSPAVRDAMKARGGKSWTQAAEAWLGRKR